MSWRSLENETRTRMAEQAMAHIDDFVYVFDNHARLLYANQILLKLWEKTLDEVEGKTFLELISPPELALALQTQLEKAIQTRTRFVNESPYTSPGGVVGYYEYTFTPALSPTGSVEFVVGSSRDTTARKNTELEQGRLMRILENERATTAAIIQNSPAFICTLRGPNHVFEIANERYHQMLGMHRQIIGRTVLDAVPEVVGQGFTELLDKVYQTGETQTGTEMPLKLLPDNGGDLQLRYVNFVYQAMREPDGTIYGIYVHGNDVTELVTARHLAEQSELQFRQIADAMPQFVWVRDSQDRGEYYNQQWREYTGIKTDAITVHSGWDSVHPDDLEPSKTAWKHAWESGVPFECEFRLRRHDGVYRWFLGRSSPIKDAAGNVINWYGTSTDIDDHKRLLQERERFLQLERAARLLAEKSNRAKDEFLALLSHELRTPLSSLLIWAHLLKGPTLTPELAATAVDTILQSATEQSALVNQLLDASRILFGKVDVAKTRFDLSTIVKETIQNAQPQIQAQQIHVSTALNSIVIEGDRSLLKQVMSNLMSNALKFTRTGGHIALILYMQNPTTACFEITDDGEGIDESFLPRLFQRFAQADQSTTRRHGGLGLVCLWSEISFNSIVEPSPAAVKASVAGPLLQ